MKTEMSTVVYNILVAIQLMGSVAVTTRDQCTQHLTALLAQQRTDDVFIPPNVSGDFNVGLAVLVAELQDVVETAGEIHVRIFITFDWQDGSLAWTDVECSLSEARIKRPTIWFPQIFVVNGFDPPDEVYSIKLRSSGHLVLTAVWTLVYKCNMDARWFPFDRHTCTAALALHDLTGVANLTKRSVRVHARFPQQTMFELVDARLTTSQLPGEATFAYVSLLLDRKPYYYLPTLVIPTAILSIMALVAFVLPPDSGEKMTVLLTTMLSYFILLGTISESTPRSSDSTPALLYLFTGLIVIAGLHSFLAAYVLRLATNDTKVLARRVNNIVATSFLLSTIISFAILMTTIYWGVHEQLELRAKHLRA